MKSRLTSQLLLIGVFAMVLAASNSMARAQCLGSTTWTDGTGDWFTSSNWSNGTSDSTKTAYINNGGQAQIHGGSSHAAACILYLGDSQNQYGSVKLDTSSSAVLDLGPSSCRNDIYVGNAGGGDLTIQDGASVKCRYGYVAAVTNLSRPGSNGKVYVMGSGSVWYLYDNPPTCTGAGLYISGTASGSGGTASVSVTNLGKIEVTNRADAPGVKVGGSGTLTGDGLITIGGGSTALSKTAVVQGTLSPSGALEIRGNLDLTPNNSANTVFNVTPTAWDSVQVTDGTGGGYAYLGGRITVNVTGTFSYFPRTFTLLHADSGLYDTEFMYESLSIPSGQCISADIQYDAKDVNLVLTSSCN